MLASAGSASVAVIHPYPFLSTLAEFTLSLPKGPVKGEEFQHKPFPLSQTYNDYRTVFSEKKLIFLEKITFYTD